MHNSLAIFPGSFDPLTLGHAEIIQSGLKVFKKIIIAIGVNENKKSMFSANTREEFIKTVFKGNTNLLIKQYHGLTVDFCKQENCKNIIRGLRNSADFEYEQAIARSNNALYPEVNTIFITPSSETQFISSSIVKEIISNKGNLKQFVPKEIIPKIYT
tara:strand:+ start:413 stop:886 length:474 start_codon:yes stop_codon:yes gene_type:complete